MRQHFLRSWSPPSGWHPGVWLGVHGRRKAGMGETFWQFRRYRAEDPSTVIDWRQSAKSQHLYVREREWEAAETVWFWRDGSLGMRYASHRNVPEKWERATVLALALGSLLVRGGERIGVLGASMRPAAGRIAMRRHGPSAGRSAARAMPISRPN